MREQESSTAQVASIRIRDGQREPNRHRRIDRVTSGLEYAQPNVGGQRLFHHHHRVPCMHRLPR